MSLVIKEQEKEYPIPDEGIYNAVCVDVVDLGYLDSPWGKKHKVSIVFELDQEAPDGSRYIISRRFTMSLNEKAHLRQALERWRNRKFKPQELKSGYDLESLLDVSAIVYVSHNETDERTYANIETILPPEKSDDGTPNWFVTRPSGEYTRVIEREDYQEPEEYAASVNGVG